MSSQFKTNMTDDEVIIALNSLGGCVSWRASGVGRSRTVEDAKDDII